MNEWVTEGRNVENYQNNSKQLNKQKQHFNWIKNKKLVDTDWQSWGWSSLEKQDEYYNKTVAEEQFTGTHQCLKKVQEEEEHQKSLYLSHRSVKLEPL